MPRKYERKTLRASWTAENLEKAMHSVKSKTMGVNEASRTFNIPSRTLRRHILCGKSKVPLGRTPVFCNEYEKKLVAHIKKLEKVGFAPDRKDVKEMAFRLANKMNIKNPFSEKSESAGNTWFSGFLARNPELSQRKSEGLSLARAYGMNREDVKDFFDMLAKLYEENDFANHPEDVYNMDESGIQVNNKPGKVVATKGAKDVYTLTSCEKGENVTVIACCNAQGNFLPPVLIYKGTYSKPQFSEGLPPGSQVFMNKKSSYINSDLFIKWFEEVFLRHKSSRKVLLILDGHSSHSNNIQLLEVAAENNVILLCLPSHTTHALQPLDRAFFRPLKVYFNQETKSWMVRNKEKKLTRYDVSKLIGNAWGKAATVSNGVSALKSCGIFPFDPNAIPDHYFSLSDSLQEQNLIETQDKNDKTPIPSPSLLESFHEVAFDPEPLEDVRACNEPMTGPFRLQQFGAEVDVGPEENKIEAESTVQRTPQKNVLEVNLGASTPTETESQTSLEQMDGHVAEPQPGSSKLGVCQKKTVNLVRITPQKKDTPSDNTKSQKTPTKILTDIHPVPKLPMIISKRKQKAVILNSLDNIQKRQLIADRRKGKDFIKNKISSVILSNRKKTMEKKEKRARKIACKNKIKKMRSLSLVTKSSEESTVDEISDSENNPRRRIFALRKKGKNNEKHKEKKIKKTNTGGKGPTKSNRKQKYKSPSTLESSFEETEINIDLSEEEISEEDVNRCAECTEDYYKTQSSEDWIQCPSCSSWLHEFCTMYNPMCNRCGRKAKRATIINT